jgi:hypothetical protein
MNIVYKCTDVIISAWNVIGALKALTRALTSRILSGLCSTSIAPIPQLVLCPSKSVLYFALLSRWQYFVMMYVKSKIWKGAYHCHNRNCFVRCIQQLRLQLVVFEFHRRQRNWRLKCTLIRQTFGHTLAIRSDLPSHWSLHCLSFRIASAVSSVHGWCWGFDGSKAARPEQLPFTSVGAVPCSVLIDSSVSWLYSARPRHTWHQWVRPFLPWLFFKITIYWSNGIYYLGFYGSLVKDILADLFYHSPPHIDRLMHISVAKKQLRI